MFSRPPGTACPEFARGEAEEIVKQIRHLFRAADNKRGIAAAADRAERRANELLETLRRRLERYLDRQIQRQIPFASAGEKEDAIAELQYNVLVRVKDTRPSLSSDHWERRFNQCVQRRAIDICRPIQKRYGYGVADESGAYSDPVGGTSTFLRVASDSRQGGVRLEFRTGDRLPDANAERELEAVLGAETLRQLIATLGPDQRDSLRLWWRQDAGETWEAIGASEGMHGDTVRKRVQAVLRVLRKIVAE